MKEGIRMNERMSELEAKQRRLSRTKLLALIVIAAVPIFLSIMLFEIFPELQPRGTTNKGELIVPSIEAEKVNPVLLDYEGWLLLQPVGKSCDSDCQQMLYLSRQVIAGLGKDSGRVERVLIAPSGIDSAFQSYLSAEHADVTVVAADLALLNEISAKSPTAFLVDPNGNIMMFYTLETAGKPMLKDLKHLLKISNIG